MLVIGLTGGIGTGKSEVSRVLRALGAEVIDADRVGHEAYRPHSQAWVEVVAAFGEAVVQPSGEIDRKRLGAIVFGDSSAMQKLNSIMHPRMADLIRDRIAQFRGEGKEVVVVEAALLVEAGWDYLVDEVWVTYSPESAVVQRLQQRNGYSEEEVRRRVGSQLAFEERSKSAQVVVRNTGDVVQLQREVESLWTCRVKGRVG